MLLSKSGTIGKAAIVRNGAAGAIAGNGLYVLRADAQRLDVFNGFLLSANLGVLFDSFLVSFSNAGDLLVAEAITPSDQQKIGLVEGMCLRWVSAQHGPYLDFHRQRFLQLTAE